MLARVPKLPCALSVALLMSGCGGGAPPPSGAEAPEPDSLVSELERTAAEMDEELARLEGGAEGKKEPEPGQGEDEERLTETSATPAAEQPAPPPSPTDDQVKPTRRDRCRTACRALESMRRSADRICEIAGKEHQKCSWARARVEEARSRVERAGCACAE